MIHAIKASFRIIVFCGLLALSAHTVKSQSTSSITVSPAFGTYDVNEIITVTIPLDTGGAATDGVDIHYLNFDPTMLEVLDEDPGTSIVEISPGTLYPSTVVNSVDNTLGRINFSQVIAPGSTFTGAGTLATVRFKALKAGSALLSFDHQIGSNTDTNISSLGTDILSNAQGASYTIAAQNTVDVEISITNSGFSPASATINPGDTVQWTNNDSQNHEVASNNHPTHSLYQLLNLGIIPIGESSSLTFEEVGTFGFHDHLFPAFTGSIDVEAAGVQDEILTGTITEDSLGGAKLTGVALTLRPIGKVTTTKGQGEYVFDDIAPGTYTLMISHNGYAPYTSDSITVPSATTVTKDFFLKKTGGEGDKSEITGTVTDNFARDTFLEGVNIALSGSADYTVRTDSFGNFRFFNLYPGEYILTFSKDGYATYKTNTVTLGEDQTFVMENFLRRRCGNSAPGDLIKATANPAVYYVDSQCRRDIFPSADVYFSWYRDFNSVKTVTSEELASFPVGRNVRYKEGTKLIKLKTDPKVYALEPDGILRWIQTEADAIAIYGNEWGKRVVDVSDTNFSDYVVGAAMRPGEMPAGTLIRYEGAGDKHILVREGAVLTKRKFMNANVAAANNFYDDFVVTIPVSLQFSSGADITKAEAQFVKLVHD